jgi:arsenate reductase
MVIEIWHNPRCSKSRASLRLIEERGFKPLVTLYLETPPTAERIEQVLSFLRFQPGDLLRRKGPEYQALSLDRGDITREVLLNAMVENPILIERPVIIIDERAIIGRPPEKVLQLLDALSLK